jgi:hypothetical protein
MSPLASVCCFSIVSAVVGCSSLREEQSASAVSDWPPSARAARYSPTATPGFDSPESFTRLLEQRWSLVDICAFCIPERRHNDAYQNLVITTPGAWKGRLYVDTLTGFDRISWYATVHEGHVQEYSLEAYRGNDFWLLEGGSPETFHWPPHVTPDPSAPYFVGHK